MTPPAVLSFESAVPVQQGHGKASFTDLMITTTNSAVAIEAKFTEPEYENVRSWLRMPPEDNRMHVRLGWMKLINKTTGAKLEHDKIVDLPYQLIHRTASACFLVKPYRRVVYLIFGTQPVCQYADDISLFSRVLGVTSAIQIHLLRCQFKKLPVYEDLERCWRSKGAAISEDVRTAIDSGPLFSFEQLEQVPLRR
jgi:hypothetical protein